MPQEVHVPSGTVIPWIIRISIVLWWLTGNDGDDPLRSPCLPDKVLLFGAGLFLLYVRHGRYFFLIILFKML